MTPDLKGNKSAGPARVGAVIYAKHLDRLTGFYAELLEAEVRHANAEYAVLQSPDIQLVIHAIPQHIARTFEIPDPPIPRDQAAIKLFLAVPSLEWVRTVVGKRGGAVQPQQWPGQGFTACNAVDPEGNIFQVRVFGDAG